MMGTAKAGMDARPPATTKCSRAGLQIPRLPPVARTKSVAFATSACSIDAPPLSAGVVVTRAPFIVQRTVKADASRKNQSFVLTRLVWNAARVTKTQMFFVWICGEKRGLGQTATSAGVPVTAGRRACVSRIIAWGPLVFVARAMDGVAPRIALMVGWSVVTRGTTCRQTTRFVSN